jgi:hypothetical protein
MGAVVARQTQDHRLTEAGIVVANPDEPRRPPNSPRNVYQISEDALSPGGQNEIVKAVIEEFCPRFTPGGHVLYIGDADEKWATFEKRVFGESCGSFSSSPVQLERRQHGGEDLEPQVLLVA